MLQQLSLSARPKTLDELIGQRKIVKRIRSHMASGRVVKAWLFTGEKGSGKTSIAKIMALSFQCSHQEVFGVPCKKCYHRRKDFDIFEQNCARLTGKAELEDWLDGSEYAPRVGPYRVYILDECHKLSEAAQNMALRYLEGDSAETSLFILCSTAPQSILDTVQRRCVLYKLRDLEEEDTTKLVESLLKRTRSELPADRLSMVLAEKGVRSPGLIAQAVEKYVVGAPPEEAADVEASTAVDVRALTKAITHGDWPEASKYLEDAQHSDAQSIRLSSIAYMRQMLLHSPEIADRAKAIAQAIDELVSVQRAEASVVSAALASAVYRATSFFYKYR